MTAKYRFYLRADDYAALSFSETGPPSDMVGLMVLKLVIFGLKNVHAKLSLCLEASQNVTIHNKEYVSATGTMFTSDPK